MLSFKRAEYERRQRSAYYKTFALTRHRYTPAAVVDDEASILEAMAEKWPDAELYLATKGVVTAYQPGETEANAIPATKEFF